MVLNRAPTASSPPRYLVTILLLVIPLSQIPLDIYTPALPQMVLDLHSTAGTMQNTVTAYMLGMLEIRKARDEAQQAMGQKFDIKSFHDRVLEDGAVPVSFLHEKIRMWETK